MTLFSFVLNVCGTYIESLALETGKPNHKYSCNHKVAISNKLSHGLKDRSQPNISKLQICNLQRITR